MYVFDSIYIYDVFLFTHNTIYICIYIDIVKIYIYIYTVYTSVCVFIFIHIVSILVEMFRDKTSTWHQNVSPGG